MTSLRFGTNIIGSTFFEQGNAIARVMQDDGTFESIDVLNTDVTRQEGAGRMGADDIQFGLCASNWVQRLSEGIEPFDRSYGVRMAGPLNVGAPFFVVRADSDMHSFDDLLGKRVAIGPEDGGMTQHMKLILAAVGKTLDDIQPVYVEFDKGTEGLLTGEVDVMWQIPVPNNIMHNITDQIDVRVLEYGPGQLQTILDAVPLYRHAIIDKSLIKGLERDTEQIGVLNVIVTHADVPEEIVYDFVASYVRNSDLLGTRLEVFRKLTALIGELKTEGAGVFEPAGVRLHPGAVRAYRDAGLLT